MRNLLLSSSVPTEILGENKRGRSRYGSSLAKASSGSRALSVRLNPLKSTILQYIADPGFRAKQSPFRRSKSSSFYPCRSAAAQKQKGDVAKVWIRSLNYIGSAKTLLFWLLVCEMDVSAINEDLANIDAQINDILRALSNGFQKLDKIKDPNRQSRQLEELTEKMRECKRLIKEFDRELKVEEIKNTTSVNKMLNDRKQAMIKELNSFVALKKQYAGSLGNKRIELFDAHEVKHGPDEEDVFLASSMTNQQLMDHGDSMMNETDQAIERSKKVVEDTTNIGAETAAALKAQTEQMSRIVNELDSIHFSMKKASQLVKEIGRQVATDRCIMSLLFLIVVGVIAIIIVKIVNPKNKDIRDIPGLAPPVNRKLLWDRHYCR